MQPQENQRSRNEYNLAETLQENVEENRPSNQDNHPLYGLVPIKMSFT